MLQMIFSARYSHIGDDIQLATPKEDGLQKFTTVQRGVHTVLTVPTPRAPNETIKSSPECCGSKVDYRDSVPVTRDSVLHNVTHCHHCYSRHPAAPLILMRPSLVIIMLVYDVTNLPSFPCEFLLLDTLHLQNMVRLKFMRSCFVLLHCLKGGKIICSRKTWLAGSGYK